MSLKLFKGGGKKPAKKYAVMALLDKIEVQFMGKPHNLPLQDIAHGCSGALLVFDSYNEAKAWGGDDAILLELE